MSSLSSIYCLLFLQSIVFSFFNLLSSLSSIYCLLFLQSVVFSFFNLLSSLSSIYCLLFLQSTVFSFFNLLSSLSSMYCLLFLQSTVFSFFNVLSFLSSIYCLLFHCKVTKTSISNLPPLLHGSSENAKGFHLPPLNHGGLPPLHHTSNNPSNFLTSESTKSASKGEEVDVFFFRGREKKLNQLKVIHFWPVILKVYS